VALKASPPTDSLGAQGDYAYLQCAKGHHDKLCNNEDLIEMNLHSFFYWLRFVLSLHT